MSRLPEKIIGGLLCVFLLVMVAYQVYIGVYASIKTETVFDYTVSRAIPIDGVAIRYETVIDGEFTGIENCIYNDGTWVSVGENVAEFYSSNQSDQNLNRARELESEIKMLEEAQDTGINNFSTTEILNRDIKEQLGYLTRLSSMGRYKSASDIRANLASLINKKQIATGMTQNYDKRIAKLKSEYDKLEVAENSEKIMLAKAPVSGYFSKIVDGYEPEFTPDMVESYEISDYFDILDGEEPTPPLRSVGKIITKPNWLFVASAPKENLEFVLPKQEVSLNFEYIGKKIPATVLKVMQNMDDARAVIILSCDQVSGDLLAIRKTQAVINFNQYTGLRVNMSDVRFLNDKRGVYVLENNTVQFKEIDPIYEEQSFILSRMISPEDKKAAGYIKLFDQVVTKGNVYDGKVIQ